MRRLLIVLLLLGVGGCTNEVGSRAVQWLGQWPPGDDTLWQGGATVWLVAVLTGVVTGWRQGIVVFRNYDDLALVFFAGASLLGAFYVIALSSGGGWVRPAVLGLLLLTAVVCSIVIAIRTWIDNRNPLWFAVALVTKVSLAAIFLIHLASLISPEGRTGAQRAKRRASALGWLVLITPVIVRLVRDHEGIWTPRTVFNQYQRGRLRL